MSDIAKLGFSVDTKGLKAGEKALDSFAAKGEKTEKRNTNSSKKTSKGLTDLEKAIGKTAAEAIKSNKAYDLVSKSLERQTIKIKSGVNAVKQFDIAQKLGLKSIEQIPRAIQKQIDSLIDLEKAEKRAKTETDLLNKTLGKTAVQSIKAKKSIDKTSGSLNKLQRTSRTSSAVITKNTKGLNKTFLDLKSTIGLVGAALVAIVGSRIIGQLTSYTDEWKNLNTQLRQVTKSESDLIKVRSQLLEVSRDTRSELSTTVNLFAEMSRGTSELGISSDRLVDITRTLNNLFLAGGKPISETIGAIRQLNQGFASGVLRGDEFNSVAEGAPKIMDALTASLKITRGELREFAATGGITAAIMITALESYSDTAQKLADTVELTFAQSIQVAKTNALEFFGQAELLNSVVGSIGAQILTASENIKAFANAALAAAATVGGIYVVSLLKAAAAIGSVMLSTIAYNIQLARNVGLTTAYGVAAGVSTIATNALNVAIKFLLGPWGLLLAVLGAAVVAFVTTKNSADELKASLNEQKTEVDKLKESYDKYIASAIKAGSIEVFSKIGADSVRTQLRLIEIDQRRLDITKEIANVQLSTKTGGVSLAFIRLTKEIEDLDAESKKLEFILKAIGKVFQSGLPELTSYTDGVKKLTTAEQNLINKLKPMDAALKKLEENQKLLLSVQKKLGLSSIELAELNSILQESYDKLTKKIDPSIDAFNKLVTSLALQTIELEIGADAFEIYAAKLSLGVDATPEMITAIEKQIKALQKLRKEQEKQDKPAAFDLGSLTKDVENFGGAWSKTGSIIVDAFGDISDSLNSYMKELETLDKQQDRIDKGRKDGTQDQIALDKLQQQVNENRMLAELGGIKSLSKAGASLFDEKTAASKAFAALSKIIAITEIALSFQKMAAKTAETGVVLTNNTAQQGSNALTAITAAFSAPFPVGFIAGAAMIGIMASLLGSVFGGGGNVTDPTDARQKAQGTGSVFGSDDKSQSIIESQERFEDLQIDQLSELRGIRDSINALSLGISQLAGSVITGNIGEFGGETGTISRSFAGFSSVKKSIIDSGIVFIGQTLGEIIDQGILSAQAFFDIKTKKKKFFGLSKSERISTEFQSIDIAIQEQMAAIFGHIGDTVLQAAQSLGFETVQMIKTGFVFDFSEGDFSELSDSLTSQFAQFFDIVDVSLEDALSQFQVDIGKVSFEGLSGEEIEAELQAIFSKQADLIAEFLVPSIAEFQKIGEGLFDTLTRVALEQAVFNDSIAKLGFDLSDLSSIMQIEVAQSIIDLIGGFEDFTDLSTSFFENFFTDAEQFAQLEKSLGEAFDSLGMSMVGSREEFRALIEGIDLTTESGQALFAALLELNPALSDFLDELERIERKRTSLQIELLKLQGNAEQALAAEREIQLAGMDESLRALQLLIFAEEDRIALLKEQQALIRSSFSMLEKAIDLEKQRALAILDVASIAHDAELNRINDLRFALEDENELRKTALLNSEVSLKKSFGLLNQSIGLEKQRAQAVLDVSRTILNAELGRISELRAALEDEKRLRGLNVANAEQVLKTSFKSEIDLIKSNADLRVESLRDFSSKEIDLIQSNADSRISSLEDERSALDNTASSMRSLVDRINNSLGLSSSNNLISALSSARLGDFSEAEKLDIGSLINLDPSGFSSAEDLAVQEAINRNRLASIGGLAGSKLTESEMMLLAIDMQISSAEMQSENQILAMQSGTEAEIIAIQEQSALEILSLESQLNTLLNIDTSILSISEVIDNFNNSQNELDSLNYEQQQQQLDDLIASANATFALDEQGYKDELERLDAVIESNKEQLNTLLGIDTNILSVADAINQFKEAQQNLDSLNFEKEIAKLDMLIESANEVFALHEQGYADELDRLDAILEDNEALLNAALGINDSVLSVADAIKALESAILATVKPKRPEFPGFPGEPRFPILIPAPPVGGIDDPKPSPLSEEEKNDDRKQKEDDAIFKRELMKNTKTTANILQRIELGGLDTRQIP